MKHILLQLRYKGVAGEKLYFISSTNSLQTHFQLNLMPELYSNELS